MSDHVVCFCFDVVCKSVFCGLRMATGFVAKAMVDEKGRLFDVAKKRGYRLLQLQILF